MTVKVVEIPKQVQCEKCRAILEYRTNDVEEREDVWSIECPNCRNKVVTYSGNIQ